MHDFRFTFDKIAARLTLVEGAIFRERAKIGALRFLAGDDSQIAPSIDDSGWRILTPEDDLGGHRCSFTLRTDFAVPADWSGEVGLHIDLGHSTKLEALSFLYGPEALAHIDGRAVQGIDANHAYLSLPDDVSDGKPHLLSLAGWTGISDERYRPDGIELVRVDAPTREFHGLARLAYECLSEMDGAAPVRVRLLTALDEAFGALDLREPLDERFYDSVPRALETLKGAVAEAGPLEPDRVFGVGHAHLDLAWLWPIEQTRKKGARTFATVLRLMEKFPEFRFSQSQPQLYQWIADTQPEIFEEIKARVASGQWEALGGMWVESDCNLAGAESLARQFVLGRQYFRREFGIDGSPILWLPDVFGYSWQLPQLIKQAGLDYFVTAKMSWNQYNRVPYDRFKWKGLDGTSILTYLITTTKPGWWGATYSADLSPAEIVQTRRAAQQPELHDELMIAYGHGDGGGGPTARMVEDAGNLSSLPGMPKVRLGTALEFLRDLDKSAGSLLPVWNGELFLELHRGTYTSQAANKRANRKMEFLLHDAEFLATWASVACRAAYPHDALRKAWQLLCLNQFHDIIPGSSIPQVYVDSAADYEQIREIGQAVRDAALDRLDECLPAEATRVVYNPTSFARSEVIDGPDGPTKAEDVPAYGYAVLAEGGQAQAGSVVCASVLDGPRDPGCHAAAEFVLEHGGLRAEFDGCGEIVRLIHKPTRRDVLAAGMRANVWQLFEDRPLDWEAWDIDVFYEDAPIAMPRQADIRIAEAGGLRGILEVSRCFEESEIVQRIILREGSDRLDFETDVNWQERKKLLKVAFPVNVLSPTATYDIQWGNVERPTHRNTSWDWARFESCAHKWVDLSEGDFGVSLLNDCKYGHDILDSTIRLTALKGATFPDPNADLGMHRFTYALLPHAGSDLGGTIAEAYALNDPLILRECSGAGAAGAPARASFIATDNPNVVVETVKRSEDDSSVVIRAYESKRTRGALKLTPSFDVSEAALCNLHEDPEQAVEAGKIAIDVTPFRIVTVRLTEQDRPKSA